MPPEIPDVYISKRALFDQLYDMAMKKLLEAAILP